MIANDLQIGDWVCAAGPVINGQERLTPPMRVVAIGETWAHILIDPEAGDPDEEDIKDIRPIPLTTDILLANGWKVIPLNRFRMEYRKCGNITAAVEIEIHDNVSIYTDVWTMGHSLRLSTPYVHKLQHALRLAGIYKDIKL